MKNKAEIKIKCDYFVRSNKLKVNIAIVILEKWNIAASLNAKEYYFHLPRGKIIN